MRAGPTAVAAGSGGPSAAAAGPGEPSPAGSGGPVGLADVGLRFDMSVRRGERLVSMAATVGPGRRLAVVGPSGAGKSTVLQALAGLVPLSSGDVWLNGRLLSTAGRRRRQGVPLHQRGIGLVAQQPALFPHLDVGANVGFGLVGGGCHPRVVTLAAALGIADVLASRPGRCSGGQRQRVALARALARRPAAVLLDEPFAALDPGLRLQVAAVVDTELSSSGSPAVLVTHDLLEAQAWGDELAVVDAGRCLQIGPPGSVVAEPGSRRVAELVGYGPAVPADVVAARRSVPPGAASVVLHPDGSRLAPAGSPLAPVESPLAPAGLAATAPAAPGGLPAPADGAAVAVRGTVVRLHAAGAALRAEVALDAGGTVPVPVPPGAPVPVSGEVVTVLGAHAVCFDGAGDRLPWGSG